MKPEVVLRQFGEFFFEFCKRSGYDHMLRTLGGGNLFEFTENLDALHSFLTLSYKVPAPKLMCHVVILSYSQERADLSYIYYLK